jgi:hypothetical protein
VPSCEAIGLRTPRPVWAGYAGARGMP